MYTQDLIKEVKELYPNDEKIHQLADSGHVMLGRYLDDSSSGSVSLNEILLATNLEEIQNKARLIKRKIAVYRKWCEQDPRPKTY